ncbi:ABC transporter ATP-binding protein [Lactobacillus sp. ESL0261]|uniref:ATP-binding cassette domain-containing protein n=1 Tax=Lactobacillus sp. ESL0261 TaxID=2069348 RepID=UPI000EFB733A|nr:ABC transporter ATP-binding protein [Lactobacillus sp. ESL0261]RMC52898.1 ABC transporter ATP-binding protein [Lactobacillus sp. ESL0261]
MFKQFVNISRVRFIIIIIVLTISQILNTVATYVTDIQMNFIIKGRINAFIIITIIQLLLFTINDFMYNLSSYQWNKQTQYYFHDVRNKESHVFLQKQDKSVSSMQNALGNDLNILNDDYFVRNFDLIANIIYQFLAINTLLKFDWILVFFTIIMALISLLIPKICQKYTVTQTKKVSDSNNAFLNLIKEWTSGLEVARQYKIGRAFKLALGKGSQKLENSQIARKKVLTWAEFIQSIADAIGRVGITVIAGLLYFGNRVGFGVIVTASVFADGIFSTLLDIVEDINYIKSTKSIRDQTLKKQVSLPSSQSSNAKTQSIEKIKLHNLSYSYNGESILHYPDLTITRSEKILLYGKSGSGKTTLIELIMGLKKPLTGTVSFFNTKGEKVKPDFAEFAYLPQDLVLFPGSVIENITMFKTMPLKVVQDAANLVALPNEFLFKNINASKSILSGGQQQKVVLARALVHKKSIMLLDEPISAIDKISSNKILSELLTSNKTLIMISHNLTEKEKSQFNKKIYLGKGIINES